MLGYLGIKDFALIKSLELNLEPGLTVISGETGAGKSIILSALGLLLGQRAASDLIRSGAQSAVVEAIFVLDPGGPQAEALAAEGLLETGSDELVVRRLVSAQGRNRVQANGSLVTLSLLASLVPGMVNLCGQHAHQVLLRPEEHLALLDAFAGLEGQAAGVGDAVEGLKAIERQIKKLAAQIERRELRREELMRSVKELEDAGLDPEEEAKLKAERKVLANGERIAQAGRGALDAIYAAERGSALESMGQARQVLEGLAELDPKLGPLAGRVDESYYLLEDAAHDLQRYLSALNFDPGRQDWVEGRLSQLQRLTRKYGGDAASALEHLGQAREELANLEKGEERLEELQKEYDAALAGALDLARQLSRDRQGAAPRLGQAVGGLLADLGMAQCRLQVRFTPAAPAVAQTEDGPLSPDGLEQAEFFIAPNPGEGFRPLARIASGGELSRILLALESLVAQRRGAATLVFDEVDAGIGGATGAAVGKKLAALSKGGQVICITHLPQIAAWADHHFIVQKRTQGGRTATELAALDQPGRVAELARMLAGSGDGPTAAEHARQMLAEAAAEKSAAA